MLYDISPPITTARREPARGTPSGTRPEAAMRGGRGGRAIAVFPGDVEPRREVLMDMTAGAAITLSTLTTTVHVGAHADGENHYLRTGRAIDEMPLEHYIGWCVVVEARIARGKGDGTDRPRVGRDELVGLARPEELERLLPAHAARGDGVRRILIKTGTQPDKLVFNADFAGLEPGLVEVLGAMGMVTVGIDTPSVDVSDSKDLPAHAAFARTRMAILEGLVLDRVPPGVYELIALPLRLVGFDASPVRAVLRSMDAARP